MRLVRPLLLTAALTAALLVPAGSASALSYPVTSTADTTTKGTLRASIEEANAHAGADSIPIEVNGTIELDSALPGIGGGITISGPGAGLLTVAREEPAPAFGIFQISGSTSTLSGLTIRGGVAVTGGGILNGSGDLTLVRVIVTGNEARSEGAGTLIASGGGIFSNGSLTLRESTVSGNVATATGGDENVAAGGGIESEGALLVERSTISGNQALALGAAGSKSEAVGGGLALPSGVVNIAESTISGNTLLASGAEAISARGGGIWGGGITITGSTIAGNAAKLIEAGSTTRFVAGDNLALSSGSPIRDSLVVDPQGDADSCANPLLSGGFNLDEDGSCGLAKSNDLAGVVAGLEPLADNGGPTWTMALAAGSAAIDRGSSFGTSVDQRGLPRPSDFASISDAEGGDGSDIGAFELQAPATPPGGPVLVAAVPGDTRPPNTRIVSGPPRNTYKTKAKFRFASTEPQSHFECKLDKKKWRACTNPFKRSVKPGKHVFKVRAIDRYGNVDPTPARFGWRVKPLS